MAEIGIMGGTFDPIHKGHLLLGRQAYQEYGLDMVWFMPSGQPPHKKDHKIAAAPHRMEMVRLAIAGEKGFFLSDFETSRAGNTYTADTLGLLRKRYPEYEFSFIIGADSLYEIEHWYHPELVFQRARILVADREYEGEGQESESQPLEQQIEYLQKEYGAAIRKLHCKEMDVSSEEIRRLVCEGKSIKEYVTKEVEDYIFRHKLYQEAS